MIKKIIVEKESPRMRIFCNNRACIRYALTNERRPKSTLNCPEEETDTQREKTFCFGYNYADCAHLQWQCTECNSKGNSNWNFRNWKSDLKIRHSVETIKITWNYKLKKLIPRKKNWEKKLKLSRKYGTDWDCKNDNNFELKWL